MISTELDVTGAAGAAPSRALPVSPSRRDGFPPVARAAASSCGTGLPGTVVRPWKPFPAGRPGGAAAPHVTDLTGTAARTTGYAERTTRTTPGALPPRGRPS